MASVMTNRERFLLLGCRYRGTTVPTNYYVALITDAVVPSVDINTFGELTEIASGQGYTANGQQLTPGATDFDVHTEDDTNDWALLQLRDITWTASGGNLPASGNGASYMVMMDDNATPANRQIASSWDLGGARTVSDTQDLLIQNAELRIA
jgi:hypothetical protein